MKFHLFLLRGAMPLLCSLLIASCTTTREVHHTEVRHDTLRLIRRDTLRTMVWMRDSVHQRDTVYHEGTTLVREHWHDHWHWHHDTLRLVQRDTLHHTTHQASTQREIATVQRPWWERLWPSVLPLVGVLFGVLLLLRLGWALWRR